VAPPGATFRYSQPGYVALGRIAETVTGKPLAELLAERIVAPLGLRHTYLPQEGDTDRFIGYSRLFGLLPSTVRIDRVLSSTDSLLSASWSAGGIVSTAAELATFLEAIMECRLLSRERCALMTDWRAVEVWEDAEYGMGLVRATFEDWISIGHGGALPGGAAAMQYYPDLEVYIGAAANTDADATAGAPEAMLPERIRAALLNLEDENPEDSPISEIGP